ncbi:MAG TPA: hypothetical protein VH723_06750, partial [Candidatus Limnocylindrales bacterium]
ELRASGSSWAKRLLTGHGGREVWRLEFRPAPRVPPGASSSAHGRPMTRHARATDTPDAT